MEIMFDKAVSFLNTFSELSAIVRMALAVLAGGAIGIERGRHGRAAGLRTHSLVCLGACVASIVGLYVSEILGYSNDPLRVGAQVISGIGFLGVGTILAKGRFNVTGLTTAAGLWATATVGLAFGMGGYIIATAGMILILIVFSTLSHVESWVNRHHRRLGIYIELSNVTYVSEAIKRLTADFSVRDVQTTPPRSALPNHVGLEAIMHINDSSAEYIREIMDALSEIDGVAYAMESV